MGIIPVHVGGLLMDVTAVQSLGGRARLVDRGGRGARLSGRLPRRCRAALAACGENTAAVSCFSFYANKTITTGEGGMAVTADDALADRMRQMSLHGLSHDAWKRYAATASGTIASRPPATSTT